MCIRDRKKGTGFIGGLTEPDVEVGIDGNQFQFIEYGRDHKGNEQVAEDGAQNKLKIIEVVVTHVAGNGYQGNCRNPGTDHAKSYQKPGRLPVAIKKSIFAVIP